MATKAKKTAGRRSAGTAADKSSGKGLQARSSHKPTTPIKHRAGGPPKPLIKQPMPVDERHVAAVHTFELGLQQEQRQNYRKACEVFEKLVASAPADVADRARVHLKACTERIGASGPTPKTAGDYHVLGVAELNVRNLDLAVEHLHKAHKLEPEREEIQYALAAAYALKGDREAALDHLRAAVQLRPQNRFQARNDPDFQSVASDSQFQAIVGQNGHFQGPV